jgi:hypothetical protein
VRLLKRRIDDLKRGNGSAIALGNPELAPRDAALKLGLPVEEAVGTCGSPDVMLRIPSLQKVEIGERRGTQAHIMFHSVKCCQRYSRACKCVVADAVAPDLRHLLSKEDRGSPWPFVGVH